MRFYKLVSLPSWSRSSRVSSRRLEQNINIASISRCSFFVWRFRLSTHFGKRHQPQRQRNLSCRFPRRLERRITFFGVGRVILSSIGSSQSRPGSKVGSSAFGGRLFCFGWPASAELFIEFIGCGETHPYFLPPNLGWPARSSSPSTGLLSLNPQLSKIP